MRQVLLGFITIVLFAGSCTPNKQKNEQDTATQVEDDGIQVIKRFFRNSDRIEYEIPVVKGTTIKHGVQKRYYLYGSLYSIIPYVAGKKQGVAYTYYQAALDKEPQVWKEQPYEDDQLNGTCKRYHRDGTLQAEYEYKEGLRAVGLKEFSESGKAIIQPDLLLSKHKIPAGYLIVARLSDDDKNADYYIGELVEGKYMPKNMKGLQNRNGVSETVVKETSGTVTITAEYSTRYRNRGVVSAQIDLP
ncbi:MAG TPA: hypothetical protein VEP89_10345 [Draconibacterium sp.]|nr:hypothetical protein [Draconibacterium sp.]